MAACPWLGQSVFQSSCSGTAGDATSLRGIALGMDVGAPAPGDVILYDADSNQWIAAPQPGGSLTPPGPGDDGKVAVASSGNFIYTDALTLASLTVTSGPLEIGPGALATLGNIRLAHASSVQGRNNANDANRVLVNWGATTDQLDVGDGNNAHTSVRGGNVIVAAGAVPTTIATFSTSNILTTVGISTVADGGNTRNLARYNTNYEFGDFTSSGTTNALIYSGGASSLVTLAPAGSSRLVVSASSVTLVTTPLQFHETSVANPVIRQANDTTSSITGDTLTVQAQNCTGSTTVGGKLVLTSGTGTTNGEVELQRGGTIVMQTTTAAVILGATSGFNTQLRGSAGICAQVGASSFQAGYNGGMFLQTIVLATSREVIGLGYAAVSATEVPSGDRVVYIRNCDAAPTSDPTTGGVLYAESGALKYRGSSGTVTTLASA